MNLSYIHRFETKLEQPLRRVGLRDALTAGDRNALTLAVTVTRDGEACLLDSAAGYAIRSDGFTVLCACETDANCVTCTLPEEALAVPGVLTLLIRAQQDEALATVLIVDMTVNRGITDTVTDPGRVIPTPEELISILAEVREAAAHAAQVSADVAGKAGAVLETTPEGAVCRFNAEPGSVLLPTVMLDVQQDGSGTPLPQNVRPLHGTDMLTILRNGETVTALLLQTCWSGTVDWASGTMTQHYGMVQLTGTELSSVNASGYLYLYLSLPNAKTNGLGWCSHYPFKLWSGIGISGGQAVYKLNGQDANTWKAYAAAQAEAGTPITLVYELKTPETVPVMLPEVTAADGETVLTVSGCDRLRVTYHADLTTELAALKARIAALEAG